MEVTQATGHAGQGGIEQQECTFAVGAFGRPDRNVSFPAAAVTGKR